MGWNVWGRGGYVRISVGEGWEEGGGGVGCGRGFALKRCFELMQRLRKR